LTKKLLIPAESKHLRAWSYDIVTKNSARGFVREKLVKHGFGDIFPAGKLFAYEFGFDEYVLYVI
jgi:hypothetical protein